MLGSVDIAEAQMSLRQAQHGPAHLGGNRRVG